jgi:hypothetical protein
VEEVTDSIEAGEEIAGLTKLLAALVEHSSEWLVAKMAQNEVQALLGLILRLTGWEGTGSVDEQISEVRTTSITFLTLRQETYKTAHITYLPSYSRSNHGF